MVGLVNDQNTVVDRKSTTPDIQLASSSIPTAQQLRDETLKLRSVSNDSLPVATTPTTPTLIARGASFEDLRSVGNQLTNEFRNSGIGGKGWTGNLTSDQNHCGQIAGQAADRLREIVKERGLEGVMVGTATSRGKFQGGSLDGVFNNPVTGAITGQNGLAGMVANDMTHAVAVLYSPKDQRVLIVDAWDKPMRVLEGVMYSNDYNMQRNGGSFRMNFPNKDSSSRVQGYDASVGRP